MQHDQGFGQHDFPGTPHQPAMGTFVTASADMFSYPMSAPATAAAFPDARYWDPPDPTMADMDMDFSAAAAAASGRDHVFQSQTAAHQSAMDSLNWGRGNQHFQDGGGVAPQQSRENARPLTQERLLAPKPAAPGLETTSAEQPMYSGNYPTPVDDPFGIVTPDGGVNPGLLFSRPPSSSMDAASFNASQPPSSSAPAAPQTARGSQVQDQGVLAVSARFGLRRSVSVKELGTARQAERTLASSPIKQTSRPGLHRSYSESRGKRPVGFAGRQSLAASATTTRPSAQSSANLGFSASWSASHGGPSRPSGRISPSKNHHRLSSLTSIPEAGGPLSRASVKFTIDTNGRARVETSAESGDEPAPPSSLRRRQAARPLHKARWDSSEDDESSTDDEPIIIPSRNASFALPDPIKPTGSRGPFHATQRSISERSYASSFAAFAADVGPHDPESEAETVTNDSPRGTLDAASEVKKVIQSRQRLAGAMSGGARGSGQRLRFASAGGGSSSTGLGVGLYQAYQGGHSSSTISPTTLTDASLPTPSTDSKAHGVRCVCSRVEAPQDGDGFMVQWWVTPDSPVLYTSALF